MNQGIFLRSLYCRYFGLAIALALPLAAGEATKKKDSHAAPFEEGIVAPGVEEKDGTESTSEGAAESAESRAVRAVVEQKGREWHVVSAKLQAEIDLILKEAVPPTATGQKKWRARLDAALDAKRSAAERAEKELRAALERKNAELHPEQSKEN